MREVTEMELYKELLAKLLEHEEVQIVFPNLRIDPAELVERKCYQALRKIKAIIEDDSLTDRECYLKIEAIICLLEELGSDGGDRHDFG